jgi:hypothetical protein
LAYFGQAIERLRSNQAGVTSKQFQPKQAAMTFLDIKVVLLAVITFCVCAPSGAVGSFSSLVIQRVRFCLRPHRSRAHYID